MEQEHGGMPVSTLREITLLRAARGHENIVTLLDVVVGRDLKMVFLSMVRRVQQCSRAYTHFHTLTRRIHALAQSNGRRN